VTIVHLVTVTTAANGTLRRNKMSYWHYQLMYHKHENPATFEGDGYYAIHEYYNMDDGDGWTENPVELTGESVEDVKKSLLLMLNDIDKHGVKDYA
jgi:hypothetical protein